MCGVQNAHIGTIGTEWDEPVQKPRIIAIKKILESRGITVAAPFMPVKHGATAMYAYPDFVCLAILEYYAFDAGANVQKEAQDKYRWLAGRSLREIIYTQLGYDAAATPAAKSWKAFHDRVSLVYDNVPAGYFCIFKEIADIVVTLINAGADVGDRLVPDISVGRAWGEHWTANNLAAQFGERQQYEHNYPDYFPQAKSNPQHPFCYPDAAYAEFKRFMRTDYLPTRMPNYLKSKVKDGVLAASVPEVAMTALSNRGGAKIITSTKPRGDTAGRSGCSL